jgi:hypothetical protein
VGVGDTGGEGDHASVGRVDAGAVGSETAQGLHNRLAALREGEGADRGLGG